MQHVDAVRLARCLKAVCDPNRIQILGILVEGEFCVSDLVHRLGIDQPKVSHHLAILRDAGIIRSRRDGRHINYSIWPNVHRRQSTSDGPADVFELGDLSVTFHFAAESVVAPADDGAPDRAARKASGAPGAAAAASAAAARQHAVGPGREGLGASAEAGSQQET